MLRENILPGQKDGRVERRDRKPSIEIPDGKTCDIEILRRKITTGAKLIRPENPIVNHRRRKIEKKTLHTVIIRSTGEIEACPESKPTWVGVVKV